MSYIAANVDAVVTILIESLTFFYNMRVPLVLIYNSIPSGFRITDMAHFFFFFVSFFQFDVRLCNGFESLGKPFEFELRRKGGKHASERCTCACDSNNLNQILK